MRAQRIALAPFYYDGLDPDGRLGGGKTLMPLSATTSVAVQGPVSNVETIIQNGPSSNRVDLVLLGDGYTEANLGTYASNVGGALDYMFASEPFKTYRTFFNAYRVDVISNESGVDNDPDPGILRDTALDMGFWCGGVERIFCIDLAKVDEAASAAPARDVTMALANSTKYGGSAYFNPRLAMFSGGNQFAGDVATHEVGHSLGRLADEYDYADGARWTFGEPTARNVSSLTADSMAAHGAKWAAWLGDPGAGYSGLHDTYEGAGYYQFGLYRPTEFSKMRVIGPPFNHPSAEGLVLQFYQFVRPIDDGTPDGLELEQNAVAFVDPVDPVGHALAIQWYVDGAPIPGATQETFDVGAADFPLGDHLLSATVTDTTWLVRDEPARSTWMTETRTWPVTIGDFRPVVTAPAFISELEGTLISFAISVSDPDGDPIATLTATGTAIAAGGVFTEDPSHASGTFQWTPTLTQSGLYEVTFTAMNGRTGRAVTRIEVIDTDKRPEVTAPGMVTGPEASLVTFDVSVVDPDGDPINSLTASGLPLIAGAVFETDPLNTSGRFRWEPGYDQSGTYPMRFVASNVYADTAVTEIVVTNVDQAPVLTALTNVSTLEGVEIVVEVFAEDPDNELIQSLTVTGTAVVAGGVFTPSAANDQGLFRWTPDFDQAGDYSVTFTAANALEGHATTAITVTDAKRPPQVSAPAAISGPEGSLIEFTATASDPDGQPVESLSSGPLPPGAEFLVDPSFTSGTFRWTPGFDQAGVYSVLLSTTSACRPSSVSGVLICDRGTATVEVTVANLDRAPTVDAPAAVAGPEGAPISFHVSAGDPDGEAIVSLLAAPLPPLAAFTQEPGNLGGTFAWTPDFTQAGLHAVTFTASNALAGAATTSIEIADVDRPPVVGAPETSAVNEGLLLAFAVTASDPDFDPITTLEVIDLPPGATFSVAGTHQSGDFAWTPGFDQAGDYVVSFRATNAATGVAAANIAVHDVNRPPVADPGGPYQGVSGIPIPFDGGASSDPDGGALGFEWVFGDGMGSTSANPLHAYSHAGTYNVSLTVRDTGDPPGVAVASTTASVIDVFQARAFVENSYRTIRLGSGKPLWCARCEATGASFAPTDVIVSSVEVGYGGGSVPAAASKSGSVTDSDRNGILDLEVCFTKEDLRTLLASVPPGRNSIPLDLSGGLTTGARVRGTVQVDVMGSGEGLAAALSPNPVRRDAVLTFRTEQSGWVRVALFDLRGRKVATLVDDPRLAAGYHDVSIRAVGSGVALASGIYFYRVETSVGAVTGRFAVMK
jgi:PKD repeat protein